MQIALEVPDVFGAADRGYDEVLSQCTRLGVTAVELSAATLEEYLGRPRLPEHGLEMPADAFEAGALPLEEEILQDEIALARQAIDERVRTWRLSLSWVPLARLREQAADAGVRIALVRWGELARLSDPELDYAFNVATSLGARAIVAPLVIGEPRRVAPFADRHAVTVAFRGDHTTRIGDIERALRHSRFIAASIDLRSWVSAGRGSPLAFLRQHADRVVQLRIETGDVEDQAIGAILREVLREGASSGWTLQVTIGQERHVGRGEDHLAAIARTLDYCVNGLRLST